MLPKKGTTLERHHLVCHGWHAVGMYRENKRCHVFIEPHHKCQMAFSSTFLSPSTKFFFHLLFYLLMLSLKFICFGNLPFPRDETGRKNRRGCYPILKIIKKWSNGFLKNCDQNPNQSCQFTNQKDLAKVLFVQTFQPHLHFGIFTVWQLYLQYHDPGNKMYFKWVNWKYLQIKISSLSDFHKFVRTNLNLENKRFSLHVHNSLKSRYKNRPKRRFSN